jgi:hypothetical protein
MLPGVKGRRLHSHCAIQKNPTEADRKLWQLRGVTILDCDLNLFAEKIQKQLGKQI